MIYKTTVLASDAVPVFIYEKAVLSYIINKDIMISKFKSRRNYY